jgi:hypothetical protein
VQQRLNDAIMVARWIANPLGMLQQESNAVFVTPGGGDGGQPTAARRPAAPSPWG